MELIDIVDKLVGRIDPIGDTAIDNERFENLKVYCELIDTMVRNIDDIAYNNMNSELSSIKKAADYASDFMTNRLNIGE